MGILDAILGTNSTSAQDAATQAAQAQLASTGAQNSSTLYGTTNRANAALQTGATAATGALNSGYNAGVGALTSYGQQAQSALAGGTKSALDTVLSANGNYQPYATTGQQANGLYADSLGLGGDAGHAAATSAFQASPGYQWSVDQATDAAARKAASLGVAGSGNTLDAVTRLGSNLANQEYSNWQNNLSGLSSQGLTAAAGISGNDQAAGQIQYGAGTNEAQLLQNTGQNIASLDASRGTGLAGVQSNLGSALSGNYTGLGQNVANSNMGVALQDANLGVGDAKAQDAATNADSGIFSKLIGNVTGLPLGSAPTAAAGAGTNAFTITPTAAATSTNPGIFGNLIAGLKL